MESTGSKVLDQAIRDIEALAVCQINEEKRQRELLETPGTFENRISKLLHSQNYGHRHVANRLRAARRATTRQGKCQFLNQAAAYRTGKAVVAA